MAAQERLPSINSDLVSFVGAWTMYGFHEDGFTSGIRAAERLGAKLPFDVVDARYIRGKHKRGMDGKEERWDGIWRMILSFLHWAIVALAGMTDKRKTKVD